MKNRNEMNKKSKIIIYTTEDGLAKVETTFDEDTVWLSMDQMAELFQRDSAVAKNYLDEKTLERVFVLDY